MEEAPASGVPNPRRLLLDGLRVERAGGFERALEYYRTAADAAQDAAMRAEALRRQSDVFRQRADWRNALDAAWRSAELAKDAGLGEIFAEALNAEASIHVSYGKAAAAVPIYEDVLARTVSPRLRGLALQNLGCVAAMERDFFACHEFFFDSYRALRDAGDTHGSAIVTANHGAVAIDQGDYARAERISRRAANAARQAQDLTLEATAATIYVESLIRQGKQLDRAEERLIKALGFFTATDNTQRRAPCLRLLGDLHIVRDEPALATRPYQAAYALARRVGLTLEANRASRSLRALGVDPPSAAASDDSPLDGPTRH